MTTNMIFELFLCNLSARSWVSVGLSYLLWGRGCFAVLLCMELRTVSIKPTPIVSPCNIYIYVYYIIMYYIILHTIYWILYVILYILCILYTICYNVYIILYITHTYYIYCIYYIYIMYYMYYVILYYIIDIILYKLYIYTH